MLLGRQGDVCTHALSTSVDTEFHQVKVNKTISERIMLVHILYYLETVMLHVFLNVDVCAYVSPQYFDALDGEHIESKIMRNVLESWVILQKKISPFVYVPSCGTLSQEHCFVQVKIKIVIKFEN